MAGEAAGGTSATVRIEEAAVRIEEIADGGWALATPSSPAPCTTSTTGRDRARGRGEPSAALGEVGGAKPPPEQHAVVAPAPSRAGPTWSTGTSAQRFLLLSS